MQYNGKEYKVLNEKQEGKILYLALQETEAQVEEKVKYKLSERSLKNLEHIHPDLVKVIKEAVKNSPYDFTVTNASRTAAEQNALYQEGRTKPGIIVTSLDGYNKKSNHQIKSDGYGYAIDLYVIVDGKLRAEKGDYEKYKKEINAVAKYILDTAEILKINIVWGGNWKTPFDPPHFELKK